MRFEFNKGMNQCLLYGKNFCSSVRRTYIHVERQFCVLVVTEITLTE